MNDSREACLTQTHPHGLQDRPDHQRPRHNGSDWQRVGRALRRRVGHILSDSGDFGHCLGLGERETGD